MTVYLSVSDSLTHTHTHTHPYLPICLSASMKGEPQCLLLIPCPGPLSLPVYPTPSCQEYWVVTHEAPPFWKTALGQKWAALDERLHTHTHTRSRAELGQWHAEQPLCPQVGFALWWICAPELLCGIRKKLAFSWDHILASICILCPTLLPSRSINQLNKSPRLRFCF